jgi:hypothetical protein
MRCPKCLTANYDEALYCQRCGHRLFAWLGDPFGSFEDAGGRGEQRSLAQPGAAAAQPASLGLAWSAMIIAGLLLILAVFPGSSLGTVASGGAIVFMLWRCHRLSTGRFLLALIATLAVVSLLWLRAGAAQASWGPAPAPRQAPQHGQVMATAGALNAAAAASAGQSTAAPASVVLTVTGAVMAGPVPGLSDAGGAGHGGIEEVR